MDNDPHSKNANPPGDDDDDVSLDEALRTDEAKEGRERGFASKMIGDLAKRALMTGIGAVLVSEDTLKGQLGEMKLPKEAMQYVVQQADRTKKEIVAAIARETRDFLGKLEMDKVLARVLTGTTIEIQTRVRILPKEDGGVTPVVEHHEANLVEDDDKKKKRRRRKDDV